MSDLESYVESTTVIVRTCGERTTCTAIKLLGEALGGAEVRIVDEVPATRAVRACYKLGISEGQRWTLIIDADVLVQPEGIAALLREVYQLPRSVFVLHGTVFDKFFATARYAGNHVYRTALLPKALELASRGGDVLRPDTFVMKAMRERGYPIVESRTVVGAHDFEQFYADVYRKCFLQARKHGDCWDYLQALWKEQEAHDEDFRVARAAMRAGLGYGGEVRVSKDFMAAEAATALADLGITERPRLSEAPSPERLIGDLRARLSSERAEAAAKIHERMVRPPTWRPVRYWLRRLRSHLAVGDG